MSDVYEDAVNELNSIAEQIQNSISVYGIDTYKRWLVYAGEDEKGEDVWDSFKSNEELLIDLKAGNTIQPK